MMSCSVTNMAWPMWSLPVTFGGGIEMVNGSSFEGSGLKRPSPSHHAYRRSSEDEGSKFFGSDRVRTVLDFPRGNFTTRDDASERGVVRDVVSVVRGVVSVVIGDRTNRDMHDRADILGDTQR